MSSLRSLITSNTTKILLGPLIAIITYSLPLNLGTNAHALLAFMTWILSWWIFSPIPLAVTALFSPLAFSIMGFAPLRDCLAPFAHPIIFLFMGSFFFAKALCVHKLDERLALFILTRQVLWQKPKRILLGLMGACTILSMWLSNTASTAAFLPVAIGIGASLNLKPKNNIDKISSSLLLAIAYSATIGGMLTPVGSPPNLIAIGLLEQNANIEISFLQWMLLAAPIGFIAWWAVYFMTSSNFLNQEISSELKSHYQSKYQALGALSRDQKKIILASLGLLTAWLMPGSLRYSLGQANFITIFFDNHFSEPAAALLFSTLLFALPNHQGGRLLTWTKAKEIDWGTLLLFGGGLSLGKMITSTGLSTSIGELIQASAHDVSFAAFIFLVCALTIFFTETASNTAAASILVPIVISMAVGFNFNPMLAAFGVCMACNMAFMLPVATPPNAIVFGSNLVPLNTMMKKGLVLNLVCLALLTSYLSLLNNFI